MSKNPGKNWFSDADRQKPISYSRSTPQKTVKYYFRCVIVSKLLGPYITVFYLQT